MNGHEELFELVFIQFHALQVSGIFKAFLEGIETGFQSFRSADPLVGILAVFADAGIVCHLIRIDFDHVFVFQEQFRNETQVNVGKIAVPAVAVLIPDLDDLHIQLFGGQNVAFFILEVADLEGDILLAVQGEQLEGHGFVFTLCCKSADGGIEQTVGGIDITKTHDLAHGADREMENVGLHSGFFGKLFNLCTVGSSVFLEFRRCRVIRIQFRRIGRALQRPDCHKGTEHQCRSERKAFFHVFSFQC